MSFGVQGGFTMRAPRKDLSGGAAQPENGGGSAWGGAKLLRWLTLPLRRWHWAQSLIAMMLALLAALFAVLVLPIESRLRFSLMAAAGLVALLLAGAYLGLRAFGQARRLSVENAAIREKLDHALNIIAFIQRTMHEDRHGQAAQMERLLADRAMAESALAELTSRMQAIESTLSAETAALREKQSHTLGLMTFLQRTVREERHEQAAQTERLVADRARDAALATEAVSQKMAAAFDAFQGRLNVAEATLSARVSKLEAAGAGMAQSVSSMRDDLMSALEDIRRRMGKAETAIAERAVASTLAQVKGDLTALSGVVAAGEAAAAKKLAEAEQKRLAAMTDLAAKVSDLAARLEDIDTRVGRQAGQSAAMFRADLQALQAELGGRTRAMEDRIAQIAGIAKNAGAAGVAGLAALEQKLVAAESEAARRDAEIAAAVETRAAEAHSAVVALKASLADIIGVAKEGAQTAAAGIASVRQEIADLLARIEDSEDAGVREIDKLTLRIAALESMPDRAGWAVDAQTLSVLRSQIAEAVSLSEQAARQTFQELAAIKTMSEKLSAMEAPQHAPEGTPTPANDPHSAARSQT